MSSRGEKRKCGLSDVKDESKLDASGHNDSILLTKTPTKRQKAQQMTTNYKLCIICQTKTDGVIFGLKAFESLMFAVSHKK